MRARVNDLKLSAAVAEIHRIAQKIDRGAVVSGRLKTLASAQQKARRLQIPVSALLDLIGFRVVVSTRKQCYAMLHLVHRHFEYLHSEYDDYVQHPKGNGYRSLHTVLVVADGITIELQVRTREMHAAAEHGASSHRRYKALQEPSAVSPASSRHRPFRDSSTSGGELTHHQIADTQSSAEPHRTLGNAENGRLDLELFRCGASPQSEGAPAAANAQHSRTAG